MADKRRGRGEDAVYFEHETGSDCRDTRYHRSCSGRWRGEITLGWAGNGKRIRKRVSGRNKSDVYDKLKELRDELELGVKSSPTYTVQSTADDWLAEGLGGRSAKTVSTNREVLVPLMAHLGQLKLRDLTATDVRNGLLKIAETRSTRAVQMAHSALVRAITHAQATDKVGRNVAALINPPEGQKPGRPSKSLSLEQARAVLAASERYRLHAYVVTSLLGGVRTEEARALRWEHVVAWVETESRWVPVKEAGFSHKMFAVYVWRSVRLHGDTKTPKSRRTLRLPQIVVEVLQREMSLQDADRLVSEELWEDHDLVFATVTGKSLDVSHVRREFKRITKAAGIGEDWTPRELRHTFVSLLSESGVTLEEIARLVGHSGTATTETVYRHELRPVLQSGAEVMDQIFRARTTES